MKTTNYEISKRLHELGFEDETDFYWVQWNAGEPEFVHACQETPELIEKIGAYDLETLIDALPKQQKFNTNINYALRIWLEEKSSYIGYQIFEGFHKLFTFETQNNETLADTAGRLLIKLIEEGIVRIGDKTYNTLEELKSEYGME